jgi:hypothetical protein
MRAERVPATACDIHPYNIAPGVQSTFAGGSDILCK